MTTDVRKHVEVKKGQRVYVVPRGDSFIVIPLSEQVDEELQKLIGDVKFNRTTRRMAETFLLRQAK